MAATQPIAISTEESSAPESSVPPEAKPTGYYEDPRREMIRFIPDGTLHILDVGCAGGAFGALIKSERAVEVWGIEQSPDVAATAERRLDKVIVADVEARSLPVPHDYFDCIVFNDILEHTRDPWLVLRDFRGYLRKGGCVVASIPNVRHFEVIKELLLSATWRYQDCGVLDRTHLRFFTAQTMKELFEDCGYHVTACVGIRGKAFPWKLALLNLLLLNRLADMRFERYACVAVTGA